MATTVEKIRDLDYDELITLGLIEQDDDLREIFNGEINMPFSILYRLQKEGRLNDETKELISSIFQMIILTKKELIDKYLRLASKDGKIINVSIPITPIEVIEVIEVISEEEEEEEAEEIEEEVEEPIMDIIKDKVSLKKESDVPRRYGKEKITADILAQGGNANPVQRAMLKVNDLKNIYVNLSARGIKDMVGGTNLLSDEDCRKIVSVITIAERQLSEILKKKK
jgi:hypothetical protein